MAILATYGDIPPPKTKNDDEINDRRQKQHENTLTNSTKSVDAQKQITTTAKSAGTDNHQPLMKTNSSTNNTNNTNNNNNTKEIEKLEQKSKYFYTSSSH